jgi:environmental stress-induced protein Ves
MSWAMVRLDEVASTPWLNGGGVTKELLAWPDPRDWAVRLSVAEVGRDGPFSPFPGVKRWFAVLSGAGVRLTVDREPHLLTARDQPLRFDGGADTACELVAGPTQDFNLMSRGRNAAMHRWSGAHATTCNAGTLVAAYSNRGSIVIRCAEEHVDIPPNTLAWRILDSDRLVELIGEDALWMEIAP